MNFPEKPGIHEQREISSVKIWIRVQMAKIVRTGRGGGRVTGVDTVLRVAHHRAWRGRQVLNELAVCESVSGSASPWP